MSSNPSITLIESTQPLSDSETDGSHHGSLGSSTSNGGTDDSNSEHGSAETSSNNGSSPTSPTTSHQRTGSPAIDADLVVCTSATSADDALTTRPSDPKSGTEGFLPSGDVALGLYSFEITQYVHSIPFKARIDIPSCDSALHTLQDDTAHHFSMCRALASPLSVFSRIVVQQTPLQKPSNIHYQSRSAVEWIPWVTGEAVRRLPTASRDWGCPPTLLPAGATSAISWLGRKPRQHLIPSVETFKNWTYPFTSFVPNPTPDQILKQSKSLDYSRHKKALIKAGVPDPNLPSPMTPHIQILSSRIKRLCLSSSPPC